jgi:hypothetical protein
MSNPNPLFQELSFDPEQVTAVNQAYDLACRTLQNIGQLEVDREITNGATGFGFETETSACQSRGQETLF